METSKTRKSIYPPIEITLDEKVYQSRKFTHSLLIEIALHEKEIESDRAPKKDESDVELSKKKWKAYCNWMRIVFGVKDEKLEEAEFAEIEDAFIKVKVELLKRQKGRMDKSVAAVKDMTDSIGSATEKAEKAKKAVEGIVKNEKRSGEKT